MWSDGGRAKKNGNFVRSYQAFKQTNKTSTDERGNRDKMHWEIMERSLGEARGWLNKMSICFIFGVHVKTKE